MLEELVHHIVEELVQGDEIRSLDVPVRLLGLEREVEGVGELLIQEIDHAPANRLREIVSRVPERFIHERGSCDSCCWVSCASAFVSAVIQLRT